MLPYAHLTNQSIASDIYKTLANEELASLRKVLKVRKASNNKSDNQNFTNFFILVEIKIISHCLYNFSIIQLKDQLSNI